MRMRCAPLSQCRDLHGEALEANHKEERQLLDGSFGCFEVINGQNYFFLDGIRFILGGLPSISTLII